VLATLVVAALAAWLFSAALFGGKVLSGNDLLFFQSPFSPFKPPELLRPTNPYTYDAVYVFHPDMQLARALLGAGELPLWNPYSQSGRPLLASQQGAPFYPLTFLAYLLPFWHSLAWIAALKVLLAGLGTFVFARSLGLRTAPSLLAGISYALGSYFVIWLEHPHTNIYLLLPWLLWLTDRTLLRGSVRWAAGLAAAVGLALLGGHPQSVVIVMLAVGLYALFRLLVGGPAREDELGGVPGELRLRRGALFAGACLLGLLAGAVMVIPFAEALGEGSKLSREQSSLVQRSAVTLVFPNYWGRADRAVMGNAPPLVEGMMYTGGVALLLAAGGLVLRRTRTQLFLLALAALAFFVAVDLGPIDNLAREIPGLSAVNLARVVIVISFAIAMLGAYGLDGLMSGAPGKGRAVAAMAVAAIAPFAWFIPNSEVTWDPATSLDHFFTTGFFASTPEAVKAVWMAVAARWVLLAVLVIGAAVLLWRGRAVAAVAIALLGLAAVDLVPLTRGYHPAIPEAWADPPPPRTITRLQELQGTDRIVGEGGVLGPNLSARYRLNDVRGHDLPGMQRYLDLYFALGGQVLGSSGQRTEYPSAAGRKLLDVFGIRYAAAPGLRGTDGMHTVLQEGAVAAVLENDEALPRAWVAYDWRAAGSAKEALDVVYATPKEELMRAPVVEGAFASPGASGAPPPAPARVVRSEAHRVELEATAARPGWLVLNDSHYPGWSAEVDGRGVDIKPANSAFRAIEIPAGRHRVTFAYRPLSVYAGIALSALALAVIAAGLLWPVAARARRRRASRAPSAPT
jgi:hypothetical protein